MKEVDAYLEESMLQETTKKIYRRDLEQFRIHVEKKLTEVSEKDLEDYFAALAKEWKQSSLQRKQSVLRKFYQFLLQTRRIEKNPFPLLQGKLQKKKEEEGISEEDYRALLLHLEEDYALITALLWETGAKLLDLFDAKRESLEQYDYKKIVGRRQNKVYSYDVPESLQKNLEAFVKKRQGEEKLFRGSRQAYDQALKKENKSWKASKIKKDLRRDEVLDMQQLREDYFRIAIGDE